MTSEPIDFRLHSYPTGRAVCIDIVPGRLHACGYRGEWAFVEEEAFVVVEGFLRSFVPDYDHFDYFEVDRATGHLLIQNWRRVAEALPDMNADEAYFALKLDALAGCHTTVSSRRALRDLRGVRELLLALSHFVEKVLQTHTHFTIRGV